MSLPDILHLIFVQLTQYLSPLSVAIEWVLTIAAGAIIAFAPFSTRLNRFADPFRHLAQRKALAILLCGIFPIVLRLCSPIPIPDPSVHDEFSHLLMGDTLAHGRLTNPTHPMWQHFETIHVIQKPTYNSMYMPGPGSFLALGEVLFHEPWAGVEISIGLMFAALCWMMQGWLPPTWALYGTLIAILKIGISGPWTNSYLGGPVSAIGGALLVGVVPRLQRLQFRPLYGVILGTALVVLMNTRPYEGALLSLIVLVYLVYKLRSRIITNPKSVLPVAIPTAVILACGCCFTAYFCWRVTGNAFRLPYEVNRETYGWPENLAFVAPQYPVSRHKVLRDMLALSHRVRDAYSSWDEAFISLNLRLFQNWAIFVGPSLTIPLLFIVRVYRDRRTRALVIFLMLMLLFNLAQFVLFPNHFAPMVPVLLTILAQGLRHLYIRISKAYPQAGIRLVYILPVLVITVAAIRNYAPDLHIPLTYWEATREGHREARVSIQAWLSKLPGKQLVIVEYANNHNPNQEWVYNAADIDQSKIVWARAMNPKADRQLLKYFSGRRAWLLKADAPWPHVIPYACAIAPDCDCQQTFDVKIPTPKLHFWNIPDWQAFSHFFTLQVDRPFSTQLLRWEWAALLLCMLLMANPKALKVRWITPLRLWFHRCAQNRWRAILISALFPMVLRTALLPIVPIAPPSVHDEFSWLLMADTFRSGRLTNPTPPFWTHYETIHEILAPTYNSMYPPASGVLLAVGALMHHPWIGVLLSVGLMCGTICWMLQGWLPASWAFGGALLGALQIGIAGYWMNSYFGAPLTALAGALVLGALPRFVRQPAWNSILTFALGVVLLINTRPFEGAILSVLCAIVAVVWYRQRGGRLASVQWRAWMPALLVLTAGAAFTGVYYWRVTGNPLKPAYVVNRETYGWPENLAFLPPQKVTYRHQILKNMHLWELGHRKRYFTFGRMLDSWDERAFMLWEFYIGPGLTIPLLLLPAFVWRSRKLRIVIFLTAFMLALNMLQLMAYPQHVAAITALFYLLVVTGMRRLFVLARRKRFAPEPLLACLTLCVVVSSGFRLFGDQLHLEQSFWERPFYPYRDARAQILSKLEQMPGKHLVFVRYSDTHLPLEEWVYNGANLEASKVVWANTMGFSADMALRKHFHDRQAWIVEPDRDMNGFLPFTRKTYFGL